MSAFAANHESHATPSALVTGASSGIGEAFARALSKKGYRLILAARRRERLEALAAEISPAEIMPVDLTVEAGVEAVAERITNEPALEILVNNAGFGVEGRVWEANAAALDAMHRLHIMTVARLTRAALRRMLPGNRGSIVNVSSVAGFFTIPHSVCYGASKAWIQKFTEGVHVELKSIQSQVRIQALCPGFTQTEFHATAGINPKHIPRPLWMTAEDVVAVSLRALEHNRWLVVPGWEYRLAAALSQFLPRWLLHAAVTVYSRRTKFLRSGRLPLL